MRYQQLVIPDVLLFTPQVFGDERGFFFESFNERVFAGATGCTQGFVQDNHSRSVKGVLRGLHAQQSPHAQGKLVRVTQGAVFDVAVDARRQSPTFGQWVGVELSADNKQQLWIPPGCLHGFLTLSDSAEFLYKTTDFYAPASEVCVAWDDPDLAIAWPLDRTGPPQLSAKDQQGLPWSRVPPFD